MDQPAAHPKPSPLPKHVSRLSAALDEERDLNVVTDIGATDPMYAYAPDLYFGAGRSALRCIRLAMLAADLQRVNRVLDFGCALGRVLRALRAGFPEASITACEIRKHDVEWCQKTFGEEYVTGVVSARLGRMSPTRQVVRNVVGGLLAMGVTYAIGAVVGSYL